jgi:RsiW-degrading membrane proteinase PrsW (M82 family)
VIQKGTCSQFVVALVALAGFAAFAVGTPRLILIPALVPAVGYSMLIVLLTRYRSEAGWIAFATLGCGAVLASTLSTTANDLAQLRLASIVGEARASILTPTIAAPILEELCKTLLLLMLLLLRGESARPMLDCIVYGALVGLGFAVVENINYFTLATVQGGTAGLARSIYLRALLGGLNHAIFTGLVGAGIGAMLEAQFSIRGLGAMLAGYVAAISQHILWNAWASQAITSALCGAADPGEACRSSPAHSALFGTVPLIAALSIAPGLVGLVLVSRQAAGRAGSPFGPRPGPPSAAG